VAYACNPSYSGGGDQKDGGLKPAQANSSRDPISKHLITKNWARRVAQGESPEFKPQYRKTKQTNKKKTAPSPLAYPKEHLLPFQSQKSSNE
jgi:hypothetical protein